MKGILAVSDNKSFLNHLKNMKVWKKTEEYKIEDTATNGKDALELIYNNNYHVVITDIKMPGLNGIELLKEINKLDSSIYVVVISRNYEFNFVRECLINGAFDFIIKPGKEEEIESLLGRIESSNKSKEWSYPEMDEILIVKNLFGRDSLAVDKFKETLISISKVEKDNESKIIMKKLYNNVIISVYNQLPWLKDYINIDYFNIYLNIKEISTTNIVEFYYEKMKDLFNLIRDISISTEDEVINEILDYILKNSEKEIKLKSIADKFYINNTYLSNTFALKTGVGFNEYVTKIKMARGKYILLNTNKKTYEVGYALGYHDIKYFSRLFKKYNGMNPSEYRRKNRMK